MNIITGEQRQTNMDNQRKAYTAIANILHGNDLLPKWQLPNVTDVTQHGSDILIVWFDNGTTYQIKLTQTDDRGYAV